MIFLIPLIGITFGGIIANFIPYTLDIVYAKYTALAILSILDAIFGGMRAQLEGGFIISKFITSFFANAALAVLLSYLGDSLNIDIYMGAVVAFSIRLFHNLSLIRELYFNKLNLWK